MLPHGSASSSATREFGVGEDSTAVECIGVLGDGCCSHVELSFSQFFSNLWVNVVLNTSVSSHVKMLALLFISVLLRAPHE